MRSSDLSRAVLEPGSVALVGGGPGAEDLITVRGLALLEQADVVVVDRLGPAGLVHRLDERVEIIEVGKMPGHHSVPQAEIEALMVERALAGRRVVRLKGGDPFLLGRGGEEVLACRAAGVPVQVVPGVTSAIAGPAAGDVPVTQRGTAVAVHIVNAHGDLGPADLAALADPATTTVLMMGVDWLPRLQAQALLGGISPDLPAAVVHSATMPEQRTIHATLETLAQRVIDEGITFPAVIALGRTAAEGFLTPPAPARPHGSGREALPMPRHVPQALTGAGAPVLIGCAHGTRRRAGRDVIRRILMDVREQLAGVEVRESYVDVQQPTVAAAVEAACAPSAATRDESIDGIVVPLLLSTGYHVRKDIGSAVQRRRALAADTLGPDPRLARILAERLDEAGASAQDPETGIVLAVAGTSDPQGQAQGLAMGELLAAELGRPVEVGFIAAASPTVEQAVAAARDRARHVAIAPYLLAPGYFYSTLRQVADVLAEPIGAHRLLTELIVERYQAAAGA
ncbi:uroporphyrinogen-III C-methyltransferase [Actinomyces slackii]|uniref:uroporphyrinogen-III C-methyltransferase n=1 Tax=Actinomyces slackii TaxID=52774 RepID=A0A3S4SPM7_9ACTO|nr:uroporphyrinogen-III C-methyltransferase [Actinomyces slackii]VEG74865.1 Siroheme synthase [Actinomyces slackii]